ncbi:hypothetical protein E3N88_35863 [Mikania micrantha]|uniref:Protein ENHANCED DISEASE RESISTANCE 2 C-terminal domain-containing protein n=1 Tax=Mikania micrantha TaxID=192012 RepID=A0A5N6M4Y2_9ASTR|nr:hypothetical protein E3N88_35863 [Mikania micrantha]
MVGVTQHWFTIITQVRDSLSWADFQSELLQRRCEEVGSIASSPFTLRCDVPGKGCGKDVTSNSSSGNVSLSRFRYLISMVHWREDYWMGRRSKVALHPKCLVQSEAGKKLPFILVVNLQVPAKPNYSLVLYFAADRPVNKNSLLGKFIDGSDAFRDSRFKLIPSIVQIDVDIGSSSVARSIIGKEEKELPEYILGTVRLNQVRLDTAVPLED